MINDYYNGKKYPGLNIELMTGWSDNTNEELPLSKITIGCCEDLGYSVWKSFETTDDMTNLEVSSAKVGHIFYHYMDGYYNINGGFIEVTAEHDFWAYTGEKWEWGTPKQLSVGNKLLDSRM